MSETSIEQVYEELKKIERNMVTKKEIELLVDTVSIVNNKETMKQISHSIEDIKHGKVKKINSVRDIIKEI